MEASTNVMRNQLIERKKTLAKRINTLLVQLADAQKGEYEPGELEIISQLAAQLQNAAAQLNEVQKLLNDWQESSNSFSRSEPKTTPQPKSESKNEESTPGKKSKAESGDGEMKQAEIGSPVSPKTEAASGHEAIEANQTLESEKRDAPGEIEEDFDQKDDTTREEPQKEDAQIDADQSKNDSRSIDEPAVVEGSDQKDQSTREKTTDRTEKETAPKETNNLKFKIQPEPGFAEQLGNGPLENLKEAIGLNERFLFSNELFNGNMEAFNRALNELNHLESIPDAERLINEQLAVNFKWDPENEAVERFILLVKRRFATMN